MEIHYLTDNYAVSPQITPADVAALHKTGFATLIDNRPDGEISPELQSVPIAELARAASIRFVFNPIAGGLLTPAIIDAQRVAMRSATGPVLAYCASGTRSTLVWAMVMAMSGDLTPAQLIRIAARQGYDIAPLRPQLEAAIARRQPSSGATPPSSAAPG